MPEFIGCPLPLPPQIIAVDDPLGHHTRNGPLSFCAGHVPWKIQNIFEKNEAIGLQNIFHTWAKGVNKGSNHLPIIPIITRPSVWPSKWPADC